MLYLRYTALCHCTTLHPHCPQTPQPIYTSNPPLLPLPLLVPTPPLLPETLPPTPTTRHRHRHRRHHFQPDQIPNHGPNRLVAVDVAAPPQLPRLVDAILPRPADDERHLGEGEETVDVVEGRLRQSVFCRQLRPCGLRRALRRPVREQVRVADEAFGAVPVRGETGGRGVSVWVWGCGPRGGGG